MFYDAEAPMGLLRQAAGAAPSGTCQALFGPYGARLAMAFAALKRAPAIWAIKVSSHTVGYANGLADNAVPAGIRCRGGWRAPDGVCWLPQYAWPVAWRGLHCRCAEAAPGATLRNWARGIGAFPAAWEPRDPAVERIVAKVRARQTWTAEAAVTLTLRYLAQDLRSLHLPAAYWNPHRGVGWWPSARELDLQREVAVLHFSWVG